jgi:hypothetical protein
MTEDELIARLSADRIIPSIYGGFYYFKPLYYTTEWGQTYAFGKVHDIIKQKKIKGQLITDWLANAVTVNTMHHYTNRCEIYCRHLTETWPNPGIYWEWENKEIIS